MRRLASLAPPLLAFGISFLAAFSTHTAPRASRASFPAGLTSTSQASITNVSPTAAQHRFVSNDEMISAIMGAAAESKPLLRAHRLHTLLADLSSTELASLFAHTLRLADGERRSSVIAELLARWVAIDPTAASAAVTPYLDRIRTRTSFDYDSVEGEVCLAWATAAPASALDLAATAPDSKWAAWLAWRAMEKLSADDAQAFEALTRFPSSRLREDLSAATVKSLAERDPAAAETHLDLISDPRRRGRLQVEILGKLASRDPDAALARLSALAPDLAPGAHSSRLLSTILKEVAKKDSAAAFASIDGFPEELRSQAMGAALVGWASQKPAEALAWAAANGIDMLGTRAVTFWGDDEGAGWNSFLGTAFEKDRTGTLDWILAQPASPQRDRMLREGMWLGAPEEKLELYSSLTPEGRAQNVARIIDSLADKNVAGAEAWVRDLAPGSERTSAIETLSRYQVERSTVPVDSIIDSWPAGADRDSAVRGFALGQNDPQKSIELAHRIDDPGTREVTFESIARFWMWRDKTSTRSWISTTPDLTPEQKRVLLRQLDER